MQAVKAAIGLIALIAAATSSDANWHVARSVHFVIYSEQDPASLRAYAEKLERFDAAMRQVLQPPAEVAALVAPVTIFALSEGNIRELIGPTSVEGLYSGTAAGAYAFTTRNRPTAASDHGQVVLLHEYAHHFMLSNFPANYPGWFTEGFAEFMSSARFNEDGSIDLGVPANDRGTELKYISDVPLADMMAEHYDTDAVLEAKGWALTHYLTFDPARKGQLSAFLLALNGGEAPMAAATAKFGDLKALDRELSLYLKRPQLPFMRLKFGQLPIAPVTVADVSAGENKLMLIEVATIFGFKPETFRPRAMAARRLATPYPDDPAAQCVLARAEYRAGNLERVEAAADRMLANDSGSLCGMIFKGRALMELAAKTRQPADAETWKDARGWFVRANRASPQDSWPMALYYYSFRFAHVPPTTNALAALLGAVDRAPQDRQLRYIATIELLRAHRVDDARIVFSPMVRATHGLGYKIAPLHVLLDDVGKADPDALAKEFEAQANKLGIVLP